MRPGRRRPQAPQKVCRQADAEILRLAHDGRGIAQVNGKVTFVANALPGETHRVRIQQEKSRFAEADSEQLLSAPAATRVAPLCELYGRCGGCQLQHMGQPAQLEHKQALVLDQLRRAGLIPGPEVLQPVLESDPWGYRHRARLSVQHKGQAFAGFRALGSNSLVKVSQCPVLQPDLNAGLPAIQQVLAQIRPGILGHIELIAEAGQKPLCILRHLDAFTVTEVGQLEQLSSHYRLLLQPHPEARYFLTDGNPAQPELTIALAGLQVPLRYRASDFTQVNHGINGKMVTQAMDWAAPGPQECWLDLFCGIGNFSIPLAQRAGQVTGVELLDSMVLQARRNAALQGLTNCQFVAADLEQPGRLARIYPQLSGLLLDPPRAGAKWVAENIATLAPAKIIYVSCDPATFARDAKLIVDAGYRLDRLGVMDMFPQTQHVETMARFVR